MSRSAFTQVGEFTPDKLIAGNTHPLDVRAVTLATGTGTLKRGTLINSEGAICNKTSGGSGDVLDTPVAILCDDVELSSTETVKATGYICGDFKADQIIVGEDVTIADFETELQKLGIFLK